MIRPASPLAADCAELVTRRPDVWEQLRDASVFITGGTGFIGSWMLETLLYADSELALGVRATVLTRDPEAYRQRSPRLASDPRISLLAGDITTFAFPDSRFTHVLHMATETNTSMANPPASVYFNTAVDGTRRVLDLAVRSGASRFLLTSSGAVYGPQPQGVERLSEDMGIAPTPDNLSAAYGHGKRAAEFMCCAAHAEHGLNATIARCFAFVGPYLPLESGYAIGNFVGDALSGRTIVVKGDGTAVRSYLYASDMALWLWTVLVLGAAARPYNVGSPDAIDIANLARRVAGVLESDAGFSIQGSPTMDGLRHRYVPDVSRAADELGLHAWIPLDEAIRRTANWNATTRDLGVNDR